MTPKPWVAKLLAGSHGLLLLALALAAWSLWHLHCEGFGCTGVGVAWLAWALLYLVVLALGGVARQKALAGSTLARAVRAALVGQLLLGAGLGLAWLV